MNQYKKLEKIRGGSLLWVNKSKNPQAYSNSITGYFVGLIGVLHCTNPKYGYDSILKIKYREPDSEVVKVGFLEEVRHY